jgi:hypothetical protein
MARERWQRDNGDPATHPAGPLLARIEVIPDPDGFTELHIPPPCFWDCVDCLGVNRLEASFTFLPPHFVARVRRASASRIHEALRNWGTQDQAERQYQRSDNDDFLEG